MAKASTSVETAAAVTSPGSMARSSRIPKQSGDNVVDEGFSLVNNDLAKAP